MATADLIVSTFIEAVIAPGIDGAARDILARKINMRVVTADFTPLRSGGVEVRSVLGAMLAQERDRVTEAHQPWTPSLLADGLRVATKRQPTAQEWEALRFAWRICAHVKSNTVVFTDARRTLAAHGRATVLARHTCAHRVDELLAIVAGISSHPQPQSLLL